MKIYNYRLHLFSERRKGKLRSEWTDLDPNEVYKIRDRKKREKYIRDNSWLEKTPDGLEYVDNFEGYYKPYVSSLLDDSHRRHWTDKKYRKARYGNL